MHSPIAANLTELSRQEKLRLWMSRNRWTYARLARSLDITSNAVAKLCNQSTMPVRRHAQIVTLGVPAELLPQPLDVKPGPKPRKLAEPAIPAASVATTA